MHSGGSEMKLTGVRVLAVARQSLLGTYLISILLVGLAILGLVYVIVNKRKIGTKKRAEKDPRRE